MIGLMIAAALAQGAAEPTDPCNSIARVAAPGPGCPGWRLVRRAEEGDGYVDPSSVRRDGTNVEIMLRTVFNRPLAGGARILNARIRLDCAARTKTVVHLSAWDENGGRIFEAPVTTDRTARPAPGTPYAQVLDEFCGTATGA